MKKKIAAITVTAAFVVSGLGAIASAGSEYAGLSKPNASWSGGKTLGKAGGGMIGFKWGNGR